jgi:hypothetical protein
VFWVVTIGNFAIYYFPADAFYYAKSLPVTYWIGIIIIIAAIIGSLFSNRVRNNIKIIPQMILALYLHAIPSLTYEAYRYVDIYTHGTRVLRMMQNDSLPIFGYEKEYPQAFMLMAQFLDITGIEQFIILKSYEIFTVLLLALLVYVTAKRILPKYAPIACLAFISLFWIDQGHFSPQAVALPIYLILWLAMIRIVVDKQKSRANIVLIILALIAINMTSPTNSLFLFLNLLGVMILLTKPIKSIFKLQLGENISKKISYIFLLHVLVWTIWSNYMAEVRGITQPVEKLTYALQLISSSASNTFLPPSPEYSYLVVNLVQYSISIIMLVTGLGTIILLYKKHKTKSDVKLPLLAGWFIGTILAGPISLYFGGPTFVERVYMYAIFPWSALIIMAASLLRGRQIILTRFFVIFILVSAMLIPLSKYGQDSVFYNPVSSLYLSESLATASSQHWVKLTLLSPMKHSFYYFNVIHDTQTRLSLNDPFKQLNEVNTDVIFESLNDQFDFAVGSEGRNNSLILRSGTDYLSIAESYAKDNHNMIINNGDARAYMARIR